MFIIAFFLSRNWGSGCQPRPSRGAYFTIFKMNWSTRASRRPNLSRINFALNSLIRSVRIRSQYTDLQKHILDRRIGKYESVQRSSTVRMGLYSPKDLPAHTPPGPSSTLASSTVLDELFMKVPSAVEPGSIERLIKVGHDVRERQILDLAERSYWSADRLALLPIQISRLRIKAYL